MQRIRIKKVPVKGDQRDYSLYDKTTLNPNYKDSSIGVQNTMGPVDRDKATVEVEKGEVVIGDTNKDGFLELFTFTGKPHSKGGTPVDIPEGSFIFSNTPKLRIKDADLLQSQFNLPMKKGGWTPAEIANKYQINEYVADLKNPDADNLTKRSSDQMLKKNMEKLGILALIQESMKGFPDGVPAIAQSVMQGLIGDQQMNTGLNGQLGAAPAQPKPPATPDQIMQAAQQQQEMQETPQQEQMEPNQESPEMEMPMQRYGGLTKYAGAGPVTAAKKMQVSQNGVNVAKQIVKAPYEMFLAPANAMYNTGVSGLTNPMNPASYAVNPIINFFTAPSSSQPAPVKPVAKTTSPTPQPKATKQEVSTKGITFDNINKIISNYEKQYEAAKAQGDYQKMVKIGQDMVEYSKNVASNHAPTSMFSWGWVPGSDEYDYQTQANTIELQGMSYQFEANKLNRVKNVDNWFKQVMPEVQKIAARVDAGDNTVSSAEYEKLKKVSKLYSQWNAQRKYDKNNIPNVVYDPNINMRNPIDAAAVYYTDIYSPTAFVDNMYDKMQKYASPNTQQQAAAANAQAAANEGVVITNDASGENLTVPDNMRSTGAFVPSEPSATAAPVQQTQTQPVANSPRQVAKQSQQQTAPKVYTKENVLDEFAYGGSLDRYDDAGTVKSDNPLVLSEKPKNAVTDAPDPNALIKIDEKEINDGNGGKVKVDIYVKGDQVIAIDKNGNTVASKKRSEYTNFNNTQYGNQRIQDIINQAKGNVIYSNQNFGQFGTQKQNPNSAIYIQDNDPEYRKKSELSPAAWDNFKDRHGDWIEANYVSKAGNGLGFDAFKKDLTTSQSVGAEATHWFQNEINKYSRAFAGKDYYIANDPNDPYSLDSKFGRITYSTPRFWDTKEPKTDPEMDTAYYCVKDANGVGSVQTVSFKKGEQPVAPTGASVTRFYSAADATANCGQPETKPRKKQIFYCVKGENNISNVVAVSYNEGEEPTPPPGAVSAFNTEESANAACSQPRQPKQGGWWLPDVVNYSGVATDQINRYEPALEQINARTPGYVLMDPTRQLAANQSEMAAYRNMAQNSASGNVALASALGSSGEGFNNAANVLANVENQNVGIVNSASNNNAQILNTADLANAQARQNYVGQMATLNQQIDNAKQQRKWRQIAAFNNGTQNWFRKKQMEQVLFPQVFTSPITGDVEFSGVGRDALNPDLYSNPYTAANSGNYDFSTAQKATGQAYTDAKKYYMEQAGMPEKDAAKLAEKHAASVNQAYMTKINKSTNPFSNFAQAMYAGATLPSNINITPFASNDDK